jgi:serine acetyltransferase
MHGRPREARVEIGENVMIGSNVRILKGVQIGNNSVIANGTVVTRSIPDNMLAFGNPAKCGRLFDLSPLTAKAESASAAALFGERANFSTGVRS